MKLKVKSLLFLGAGAAAGEKNPEPVKYGSATLITPLNVCIILSTEDTVQEVLSLGLWAVLTGRYSPVVVLQLLLLETKPFQDQ